MDNPDASPLRMLSFLLGYNTRTHKTDPYGPIYLHKREGPCVPHGAVLPYSQLSRSDQVNCNPSDMGFQGLTGRHDRFLSPSCCLTISAKRNFKSRCSAG